MDKAKVSAKIGRKATFTIIVPGGYSTFRAEIVRVTDSGVYMFVGNTVGVELVWAQIVSVA